MMSENNEEKYTKDDVKKLMEKAKTKVESQKVAIEKKNAEELSKLDLRDEIERILNEHSDDYKNVD